MSGEKSPLSGIQETSARPTSNFAAVVDAHWTAVYRLLYSLAGNPHDSEDLTQETFLRALKRWDTFKDGTNLKAWLLRIATNAFYDVNRRRQTLKINPLPDDIPGEEPAIELALEQQEQGELIRAAMQELSETMRLVFHLRVTEDLSFKEIAEIAGTTEVAARQHMHQARLKLLKRLNRPDQ
jgi:RNA polymerase sigma-70 factor (ECF subfamily)